jgi:hypothetical protein
MSSLPTSTELISACAGRSIASQTSRREGAFKSSDPNVKTACCVTAAFTPAAGAAPDLPYFLRKPTASTSAEASPTMLQTGSSTGMTSAASRQEPVTVGMPAIESSW